MASKRWILYVSLFIISFLVRLTAIHDTPQMDKWIDLAIYMDGGQLIVNGVNPYNFLDDMELRDSLRTDTIAYNYFVDETQDRWNFYASGNLPLSLLYFGAIETITQGDAFGYRVAFALADSLLAVMIAVFILHFWQVKNRKILYPLIIGLGFLSPVLLYHGSLLPEDKGLQILFMISALYFSEKKYLVPGALFLGWSIAFKGLGVFIAPLCLYFFMSERTSSADQIRRPDFQRAALFIVATTIFCLQPFLLYLPEVFDMMLNRLDQNLNATIPTHSSIWRLIYHAAPDSWQTIKLIATVIFIVINVVGLLRKRFGLSILTASLLLWFVDISLLAGSLDRMNIGFLTAVLLMGVTHRNAALLLSAFYIFAGSIVFFSGYVYVHKLASLDPEIIDSAFGLMFVLLYVILLAYYAIRVQYNQSDYVSQKTVGV